MRLASFRYLAALAALALIAKGQQAPVTGSAAVPPVPASTSLLEVKRIYVAQLTGGPAADTLRELVIASLNSSKLFVLTENPDRADATLKGAADDHIFEDTFDSQEGINVHVNGGSSSGGTSYSKSSSGYGGASIGENESRHTKERKHEAFLTVRLCNREGDVIWSTTQESLGAKFRGASADAAAKVAHQLTLDVDRVRRASLTPATTP